ncbi:glycoside hydrolase family 97 protein [Paenibacillus sp. YN15]|uniref:glycoside hydrolase family 97 protein n=1 Tax=Paenibacillus sp. YN15 TaxID=1742774 RepID=UPI0015EBA28C|nr:glycoside hydrolase family 97 protein [Paenibacillus sp. YN15]
MEASAAQHHAQTFTLVSPGGMVKGDIRLSSAGVLVYSVAVYGESVVEESELGITVDGVCLGSEVRIEGGSVAEIRETYPTRGCHTQAVNHCFQLTAAIRHVPSDTVWTLMARCYDDGFAFRYVIPGEAGAGSRLVGGEASSWTMPAGSSVWYFERDNGWKLKSYAGEWLKVPAERLHEVSGQGPVQGTPLVYDLAGGDGRRVRYAAVMEAALSDYSGMRIEAQEGRRLRANFTEGENGFEVAGTIVTPWRVVLVSPDLDGLVNSDLLTNLNPAPSPELFADTGYIRPGRSVWRWWSLGTGTPEEERRMIDCAQELGFEYTTIDEGWERWDDPWGSLRELTAYAAERGIGVFVWKRSKEINHPADGWASIRSFFRKVKEAGCAGLKVDFIDCEDKASIDFEVNALRIAAELKLMINFHGISKPTGESRTYPNEISREGIRGLELNKMKEGPIPAFHNAALPFTRFVAGHGDYTPVGFTNPGATTWAHQLATAVLFTSPLQVIAENPEVLLRDQRVAPALELLKAIPSVWDETRVLPVSDIARLAVMARRSGQVWFLAALNGTGKAMTVELELAPLLGDVRWGGVQVLSPTPEVLERRELRREPGDGAIRIALQPADGWVAMITPN